MLSKLGPWFAVGSALMKTDTGRSAGKKVGWGVTQWGAAFASGLLAKKAVTAAWTAAAGGEPPANPADPGVDWGEAVSWSVAIGVGYGVGRVAGRRLAAAGWEKATGELPPGFEKQTDTA